MTTTLFIQILNMSLGAAWAALLVMVFRCLLHRLPKAFSYALWGVVLFRLVCPVSFSSVFSLMPRPQTIPQEIVYAAQPQVESGFVLFDQAVNQTLPSAPPSVPAPAAAQAAVNPVQLWLEAGKLVWLAGAALLLLYGLVSYLRFSVKLRGAVRIEAPGWQKGDIWESDRVPTAFVMGLFRPRVYLPAGIGEKERRFILCHEQAHIRRMDHIIKPFSLLLLTIHWFNPVLWLAYFLMRRDMEMSCDELAMKMLGEENRKDYSACLLNLSARQSGLAIPLAFGENDVKGRIVNILRYKKPALWATAAAVVLVCALGFCLLANPSEASAAVLPGPDPGEGNGITLADADGGAAQQPNASVQSDPPARPVSEPEQPAAPTVIHYTTPVQGSSQQTLHDNHLDYGVDLGTPVYSPIRGTVEEVSDYSAGPYGKTVAVRSSEKPDVILTMAHLQTIAEGLKAGDTVDSDTQLGTAGATGYTNGPIVAVVVQEMTDGGQALAVLVERWDDIFAGWRDGIPGGSDPNVIPKPTAAPTVIHYTAPVRNSSQQTVTTYDQLKYRAEFGAPVYSPIRGILEEITPHSVWPYGKSVVVRSSENPSILLTLAHLSAIAEDLKAGDAVDNTMQIAAAGATGNASYNQVSVVIRRDIGDGQTAIVRAGEWDGLFDDWRGDGDPVPDPYLFLSPINGSSIVDKRWASPQELGSLLFLFEDLYTYENGENPSGKYGEDWPVADMVETLSRYFENITAEDFIESLKWSFSVYDPATDTVRRSGEREATPPSLISAVKWARVGDDLLAIDYDQVYSYVGNPPDKTFTSRLTVKLLPDGSFRYLSNLDPKDPRNLGQSS